MCTSACLPWRNSYPGGKENNDGAENALIERIGNDIW